MTTTRRLPIGAEYRPREGTQFRVWAPAARQVDVVFEGGAPLAPVPLQPEGDGYFWMAGESAQMRAIRKHLMRERKLPSTAYDVMGYWRSVAARQPRAVDPGPIWRAGKAAGKTDEEIWADYDQAREQVER